MTGNKSHPFCIMVLPLNTSTMFIQPDFPQCLMFARHCGGSEALGVRLIPIPPGAYDPVKEAEIG